MKGGVIYGLGDKLIACTTGPFSTIGYFTLDEYYARKTLEYLLGARQARLNDGVFYTDCYTIINWKTEDGSTQLIDRECTQDPKTTKNIFHYIANENWKTVGLIRPERRKPKW